MEFGAIASLFAISFLSAAAPGPGIIFVLAVGSQFGAMNASKVVVGALAGTAILLALTFSTSFGMIAFTPSAFEFFQWVGTIVLAYLAWILWPRGRQEHYEIARAPCNLFWKGMALSLSQPLHLVFLLAIVPQFFPTTQLTPVTFIALSAAVLAGDGLALISAAFGGSAVSRYVRNSQTWFGRIASFSLAVFSALSLFSAVGWLSPGTASPI